MMIGKKLYQHIHWLVIVLLLSLSASRGYSSPAKGGRIRCLEREREALLKFKEELVDEYGRLSSWGTHEDKKDCCTWKGVYCRNHTNHVIELDLLGPSDYYGYSTAPLRGNLSELQRLSVSGNSMLTSPNLNWLSPLHSLRYLDLSYVNLTFATDWLPIISKLTRLQVLYLSYCHLPPLVDPLPSMANASNILSVLHLVGNNLSSSSVFPWLFNFSSSLNYLHITCNNLQGPIPNAIGNIALLEELYLDENQLDGGIPSSFGNLSSLMYLSLSDNQLTGTISGLLSSSSLIYIDVSNNIFNGTLTERIGSLSELEYLDLGTNRFEGVITEAHFFGLSRLSQLCLFYNLDISFNFSSRWNTPFQLTYLGLRDCKLGPHFPTWLHTQKELHYLDISNAGIHDSLPD
ncbi:Hypothetical predicted protein [Olea europaea subsp. europaea]|uniref:Leucine-rich repeat-containing N-terminal plant-type domain-containing protein n=1 Tax=Olea europaea subsp. europaea TaxID=158383 RepID=A0A8S0QAB8_OLEEU|nr:Hypothetical predicted protein [Olea europaea subsp. europaea]